MYAVVQEYTRERRQQLDRIKAQIEMNGCTFSVRMSMLTTCLRPHDHRTCGILSISFPFPFPSSSFSCFVSPILLPFPLF